MKKIVDFVKDSIDEMTTKVAWPKFSELQGSSTLVLVASLIFALIIGGIDFVFDNGMNLIYQNF